MAYAVNELDNTVDCYHVDQASCDLARSEQTNVPFPPTGKTWRKFFSVACLRAKDTGCNVEK